MLLVASALEGFTDFWGAVSCTVNKCHMIGHYPTACPVRYMGSTSSCYTPF